jgi:hypothetical protein
MTQGNREGDTLISLFEVCHFNIVWCVTGPAICSSAEEENNAVYDSLSIGSQLSSGPREFRAKMVISLGDTYKE